MRTVTRLLEDYTNKQIIGRGSTYFPDTAWYTSCIALGGAVLNTYNWRCTITRGQIHPSIEASLIAQASSIADEMGLKFSEIIELAVETYCDNHNHAKELERDTKAGRTYAVEFQAAETVAERSFDRSYREEWLAKHPDKAAAFEWLDAHENELWEIPPEEWQQALAAARLEAAVA